MLLTGKNAIIYSGGCSPSWTLRVLVTSQLVSTEYADRGTTAVLGQD